MNTRGRLLALVPLALLPLHFVACSGSDPVAQSSPEPAAEPAGEAPAEASSDASGTAVAEIDAFIASGNVDKTAPSWKTNLPKPPQATFDGKTTYHWVLETNVGSMRIRLFHDVAPMHVSSTIYLTRLGFYDDVSFHRVIPRFMAQGGDPLGKGFGGPGYKYDGEFHPDVKHDRGGLLSMANAGPGTDGSQFFITFVPYPSLDGKHTIFGEVVDGMDTVQALEARGTPPPGTPKEPLTIVRATIETTPGE